MCFHLSNPPCIDFIGVSDWHATCINGCRYNLILCGNGRQFNAACHFYQRILAGHSQITGVERRMCGIELERIAEIEVGGQDSTALIDQVSR